MKRLLIAAAIVAVAGAASAGEWEMTKSGNMYREISKSWSATKIADPITKKESITVCGYDDEDVHKRVCFQGANGLTSIKAKGQRPNTSQGGAVVDVRFEKANGQFTIKQYYALDSDDYSALMMPTAASDFKAAIMAAERTTIRFRGYGKDVVLNIGPYNAK